MNNTLKQTIKSLLNEKLILGVAVLAILLVKLIFIRQNGGLGWEPDEYMHFLQLKTIFVNFPQNFSLGLGVWEKPLYSYPFAFLVWIFNIDNLAPLQILNTIIFIIVGLLVYKILRRFGAHFSFALLGMFLVNFSYLLFRSSLSGLTEPIFMLFIVSGYYFLTLKRYKISSLLIGLAVLGRIEGAFFVGLWGLYYIFKKMPLKNLILNGSLLILPMAIWNFLGFLQTGRFFYLIDSGYPKTAGLYGFGSAYTYYEGFIRLDPLITIFYFLSITFLYNFLNEKKFSKIISSFIFLSYFAVQTFLYVFGLFGTAGLMRYFIAVIPLMIVAIIIFLNDYIKFQPEAGLPLADKEKQLKQDQLSRLIFVGIFVIIQISITSMIYIRGGYYNSQQLKPSLEIGLKEGGQWIKENLDKNKPIYSDRPEVLYFAQRDLTNTANSFLVEFKARKPGIYVWSKGWGKDVFNTTPEDFKNEKILWHLNDNLYIFEIP